MPRVVAVDIARNFGAIVRLGKNARINYEKYYKRAIEGDRVHKCFAYGVAIGNEADVFISVLRNIGYEVKYKRARLLKNKVTGEHEPKIHLTNNNINITMDIVKNADKVDNVVLGTNDIELLPLIDWLRNKGIKIHIFSLLIPIDLKNSVDSYEEISNDMIDY